MNLFKFRSADNLDRILDIILMRRLYCSDVKSFNDLREGDIRVGNDLGREIEIFEFGQTFSRAISEWRVCSLCKTFNNNLLWAHYADGFRGVAIDVDIPSPDVTSVTYSDDFVFLSDHIDEGVDAAVRSALSTKARMWQYEQEARLITREEFYNLTSPVQRLIVGPRIEQPVLRTLAEVCSEHGISIERAIIADWGVYTVGVQGVNSMSSETP